MGQLTNQFVSSSYQGLLNLQNANTGFTENLQTITDGLGGGSPLQISKTQVNISGSLTVNGQPITIDSGSLVTTSSFNAFTSSIDGRVDALELETSSLQNQINEKLNTSSFNSYTSSNDSKVNSLISQTGSYVTETESGSFMITGSVAGDTLTFTKGNGSQFSLKVDTGSLPSGVVSGSQQITDLGFATTSSVNEKLNSSSFNSYTSSNDSRVNSLESKTGSYATTGSNVFNGTQTISGSINVTGELTALSASITYLKTIYQTSSIVFSSGSNILGDEASDVQTLNGTVNIPLGNVNVTGLTTSTLGFSGNLQGTSSYATQALSASYAPSNPLPSGVVSGSSQIVDLGFATTSSVDTLSGSIAVTDLAQDGRLNSLESATSSYITSAQTSSMSVASASFATNAVTSSIAFDLIVRGKCDNPGGLTKGTIVRITGANGDNPLFNSASWTDDANSANTLGMLTADVAYNDFQNIVAQGTVIGINTNGMTAGDMLYLSSSGQYTNVIPPAPYHEVRLGQVLRPQLNQGSAYISIDNGYELSELHDVDIINPVNGDLLVYRSGSYGQWVNENGSELGFATTGSNTFVGNQIITGSVTVRGNDLDLVSNNTTLNIDNFVTNSLVGQTNIIKGWGDNPLPGGPGANQANYTGSLRITGSNNTVSLPQLRATGVGLTADHQGYISGSDNILGANNAGIYLNNASQLLPKTQGNFVGFNSNIGMTFTTSSLASPIVANNMLYAGALTLNHPSGSVVASSNLLNGAGITSTQNFVTNVRPSISANIVGNTVTLNHISSSISYAGNINNSPVTINNHLSSSIVNNALSINNNLFLGGTGASGIQIYVSGSQSSNVARSITDNLIGGRGNVVSSSFISSSNSSLISTLIYGNGLTVSGSHIGGGGGSAFLGRNNDTTSLHLAQDIVFAVGTGISTAARRTGLYVTSGSLVGISGSMDVKGNSTMTGSLEVSNGITGSFRGDGSGITGVTATLPAGVVSGSAQVSEFGFATTGSNTFIGNQIINGSSTQNIGTPGIDSQTDFITVSGATIEGKQYNYVNSGFVNYPGYGIGYADTFLIEYYSSLGYEYGAELQVNGRRVGANLYASGSGQAAAFSLRDVGNGTTSFNTYADDIQIGEYGAGTTTRVGIGHTALPNLYLKGQNISISGSTHMYSSDGFPLYVDGTINSKRLHFTGNPFNTDVAPNLGALRFDGTNTQFYLTNYDNTNLATQSIVGTVVQTGSNLVQTFLGSNNNNFDAYLRLTNNAGVGSLTTNVNTVITGSLTATGNINGTFVGDGSGITGVTATLPSGVISGSAQISALGYAITGSNTFNGSQIITGSLSGNVGALSITSNTASMDTNTANFFTLTLPNAATHILPTNIKPGQTINVKVIGDLTSTVTFPTSVKQPSGSAYVPTVSGTDILTFVSFDGTDIYMANVKKLI